MKFKYIVFYISIFITIINCNNDIINLEFINDSITSPNIYYYINNDNQLYSNYYNRKPSLINSYIPLNNSKILGSYSYNNLFIIGSEYLNNGNYYNLNENDFKIILIVDDDIHRSHHSMTHNNNNSIIIYSMDTMDNNILSISIFTIDLNNINLNNIIYLSKYPKVVYKSNIIVNPLNLKLFKFNHDKINKIYSALVQEYGTGKSIIVQFGEFTLRSYEINTTSLDFSSLIFGNIKKYAIIYGINKYNGNQVLVSYNLKFNTSTLESQFINQQYNNYYYIYTEDSKSFSFYRVSNNNNNINKTNNNIMTCYMGESVIGVEKCNSKSIHLSSSSSSSSSNINNIYLSYNHNGNSKSNTIFIISLLVPIISVALLLFIGVLCYTYHKKKKDKENLYHYNNFINEIENQFKKEDNEYEKEDEFDYMNIQN